MHESVQAFVRKHIKRHHVEGGHILEVGSYDVNGSVRPYLESLGPKTYTGVDIVKGPGVDLVYDPDAEEELPVNHSFYDLVISTEMLEHARSWKKALREMLLALSKKGLLLLTARGPGFPFHNPPDYWRFTPEDIRRAFSGALCPLVCEPDPQVPGVFFLGSRLGENFEVMRTPGGTQP
jgi:SAM-dependent methyltransferase